MNLELSDGHQVAESFASGSITMCLVAATNAQQWFSGSVTAYTPETKAKVLGNIPGPVVTAQCATEMTQGFCWLTGATISVSVTGVGGPEPAEGKPAGTVFIAMWDGTTADVKEQDIAGTPETVPEQTDLQALRLLRDATNNAGVPPMTRHRPPAR